MQALKRGKGLIYYQNLMQQSHQILITVRLFGTLQLMICTEPACQWGLELSIKQVHEQNCNVWNSSRQHLDRFNQTREYSSNAFIENFIQRHSIFEQTNLNILLKESDQNYKKEI